MSSLKKFSIHYTHFLTGGIISLMIGLVSFPILTRMLTREEYGVMGLVSTTMLLAAAVAKAGLSDGIIRFYKSYSDTPERLNVFSSTVAVRGFVFSAAAVLLYLTAFPVLGGYLSLSGKYILCFLIMSVYLLIRPLNIIVLNILRATEKTVFYNVVNLVGKVSSVGLSVLLLIVMKKFYWIFIGLVISESIVSAILFYWFLTNYRINVKNVSGGLAMKLIKFGIPVLLTELSYLLLSYADRYMIVGYKGEDALGLYSVGYNLAAYMSDLLMFSLAYAVIPIYVGIYEKEGREKTEVFLQRCLYYMLIAVIPICVGYFAVCKDLFVTLASVKYIEASTFSPIILLGSLLLGMNNILNAGLFLKKKTVTILAIMLAAVIVNIILNIFLIPSHGVMGAAVATLLACMVTTVMTVLFSYRYINIRFDLKIFFYYTAFSMLMYLVLTQIETSKFWLNLVVKSFTGFFIMAPVVLFREKEILLKVKGMVPFKIPFLSAR